MKKFSDRLRHARELRGYTQQSLARAAGMSQSAVASYENGERKSSRGLLALSAALNVEPQWLDTGKGPMTLPRPGHDAISSPNAISNPYAAALAAPPGSAVMEPGAAPTAYGNGDWPFAGVARTRFERLTDEDKRYLETIVAAFMDACLSHYPQPRPKSKTRRGG